MSSVSAEIMDLASVKRDDIGRLVIVGLSYFRALCAVGVYRALQATASSVDTLIKLEPGLSGVGVDLKATQTNQVGGAASDSADAMGATDRVRKSRKAKASARAALTPVVDLSTASNATDPTGLTGHDECIDVDVLASECPELLIQTGLLCRRFDQAPNYALDHIDVNVKTQHHRLWCLAYRNRARGMAQKNIR